MRISTKSGDGPQESQDGIDWVQEHQGLVHYVDANPIELADTEITPRSEGAVSIKGKVCVINERLALAHTHVPDIALAAFGTLLGPRGGLYSRAATYYHHMHPSYPRSITTESGIIEVNSAYEDQRRLALVIGSMMLRLNGFSYTHLPEQGVAVFDRQPA